MNIIDRFTYWLAPQRPQPAHSFMEGTIYVSTPRQTRHCQRVREHLERFAPWKLPTAQQRTEALIRTLENHNS